MENREPSVADLADFLRREQSVLHEGAQLMEALRRAESAELRAMVAGLRVLERGRLLVLALCCDDRKELVLRLLAAGFDPNAPAGSSAQSYPLMVSCMNGALDVADLLLSAGADPFVTSELGNVLMPCILLFDKQPAVSLELTSKFLGMGVDPNVRIVSGEHFIAPLDVACDRRCGPLIRLLIANGATVPEDYLFEQIAQANSVAVSALIKLAPPAYSAKLGYPFWFNILCCKHESAILDEYRERTLIAEALLKTRAALGPPPRELALRGSSTVARENGFVSLAKLLDDLVDGCYMKEA